MALALKSWKAVGTSVLVLTTRDDRLEPATTAVRQVLEDVDAAYSRFREDSELTHLNANPGRTIHVSPLLATASDAALRAARITDGAVDPTIGRAIRVAGYDDDFSRLAGPHPALPPRRRDIWLRTERVPGWQAIRLDRGSRTVWLPQGVELDLGSTGKALAADLAATAAMAAAGEGGVLVSLGGDIGTAGASPSGGWRILVAEDSRPPLVRDAGRRHRQPGPAYRCGRAGHRFRDALANGLVAAIPHHRFSSQPGTDNPDLPRDPCRDSRRRSVHGPRLGSRHCSLFLALPPVLARPRRGGPLSPARHRLHQPATPAVRSPRLAHGSPARPRDVAGGAESQHRDPD